MDETGVKTELKIVNFSIDTEIVLNIKILHGNLFSV